jgi:hypothetical protein
MHRWHKLTLIGTLGAITACGGADRHSDTPVDTQGGSATGGSGPSGAEGVPPAETTPPTTPDSEPSNVPPEASH